ncbi:hypothetical protein ST47_g10007 [Ascochyta rabiei]|uniref:Uncharacterized protein n=1 Tax=Didymella rabiei TaxID=5454 RepID=A0A162W5Q0_DIDRA|nr:hypothetical protein ST47_g10007 [Ascochyta rabiei]
MSLKDCHSTTTSTGSATNLASLSSGVTDNTQAGTNAPCVDTLTGLRDYSSMSRWINTPSHAGTFAERFYDPFYQQKEAYGDSGNGCYK